MEQAKVIKFPKAKIQEAKKVEMLQKTHIHLQSVEYPVAHQNRVDKLYSWAFISMFIITYYFIL